MTFAEWEGEGSSLQTRFVDKKGHDLYSRADLKKTEGP